MGQLRALVEFRLHRLRHRLFDSGGLARVGLVFGGAGILLVAGYVLSPDQFGPTRSGGGVIHWGGWPLESAFYLGCLVALVQSFRILEAFFRHPDARFLATYPVRLHTLFVYRLGSALLGTGALAGGCAIFLLPVGLKGGWFYFLWSTVLLAVAVLLVVSVGFAAQMAAGVANYRHVPGFLTDLDERSGGSTGSTAAYLFSPAIALGASLLLILLAKLSIEEIFKRQASTGTYALTGVGRATGIFVAVVVAGCLLWAYRHFTRHFPLLFARFFELDLVVLDVGYDYFARDRKPPSGLEARLPPELRTFYRLDRLQMARRSPLARMLAVAGPIVAVLVFVISGDRIAPWMVVGAGLAWLLLLANPWSRLFHPDMEPGMGHLLPVPRRVRRRARTVLLAREILVFGLPLGLAGLTLPHLDQVSAALVVAPVCLAALPLLVMTAERSHRAPRGLGFLLTAVLAALTGLGAWGPWAGALALAAVSLLITRLAGKHGAATDE